MKYVEWDSLSEGKPIQAARMAQPMLESMPQEEIDKYRVLDLKKYGIIDQPTLEALMVAMFIADPQTDQKFAEHVKAERAKEAEETYVAGIRGDWFENKFLGAIFEKLREVYREHRRMITIDEAGVLCSIQGQTQQQTIMYKDELYQCLSLLLLRKTRAYVLVMLMTERFRNKRADELYQSFARARKDPAIGISKAVDDFRAAVIRGLATPGGGAVQEHDWISDYKESIAKFEDMKRHPEKYTGYMCGIKVIDDKTRGFRPGHLSVFVGSHGGFKTTSMINVAYGLWANGYNVLYCSLEMEAEQMKGRLWCRATRNVKFSKLDSGHMSATEDHAEQAALEKALETGKLTTAELARLERLKTALTGIKAGCEDKTVIGQFYEENKDAPARLKIINVGQSSKIKCSQIEQWLKEKEGEFRPQVVIVDYLDLVASETSYPDRRDMELGDICKYLRQMGLQRGFAVVTAAQFKRDAVERFRKFGMDKMEKIQIGTDDIAGSHQIGADADEVFMLFREKGGNSVRIFTAKARHSTPDTDRGEVLQVNADSCYMDTQDRMEDMNVRNRMGDMGKVNEAVRKMAGQVQKGEAIPGIPMDIPPPIDPFGGDFDEDYAQDDVDNPRQRRSQPQAPASQEGDM